MTTSNMPAPAPAERPRPEVHYEIVDRIAYVTIDRPEALHWGLVNKVVPSVQLKETVEAFARGLLKNAPLTLQRYKHMTVKGWELPVASALRLDVGPNPYLSADRAEGVRAFVEKREPRWQAK